MIDRLRAGQRVRTMRIWKGLTTYELSKRAHISQYELNRIENGYKQKPESDLEEIARVLHIPYEFFVCEPPTVTGLEDWCDLYIAQEFERRFCK